jgi:glutamate--cysteine ligase catalytic subunit
MIACKDIGMGKLHVPELLGSVHIDPITTEGAYDVKLDSKRVQNEQLLQLLRRYTNRKSFSESHAE